jgi:hypothetical protein
MKGKKKGGERYRSIPLASARLAGLTGGSSPETFYMARQTAISL